MPLTAQQRTFHFVGIGGAGMSALAEIMLELGHRVQGSDREASAVTAYLQKQGGKVIIGHNAANVNGADVLIYSSAVKPSNPERAEAQKRGIAQMRRAELLGLLMGTRRWNGFCAAGPCPLPPCRRY